METYRACNVFERVLAATSSPRLPAICFDKVVDLIFRCTYVDGSSTLVTRCGVNAWMTNCMLSTQAKRSGFVEKLQLLRQHIEVTSKRSTVEHWCRNNKARKSNLQY